MNILQGQVNTPTGCVSGDQIPLNSDKCFNNLVENRSPQVYQQLDKQTGILPKTGGDIQVLLPILFTLIVIVLRIMYSNLITSRRK